MPTPSASKNQALELFLGPWCDDAGQPPYEDADLEALSELIDLLVSLSHTPYFGPVAAISRQLAEPLYALTIWDLLTDISRCSTQLAAHEARRRGATWDQVGAATAITRSSALQRYEPSAIERRRLRAQTSRQRTTETLGVTDPPGGSPPP